MNIKKQIQKLKNSGIKFKFKYLKDDKIKIVEPTSIGELGNSTFDVFFGNSVGFKYKYACVKDIMIIDEKLDDGIINNLQCSNEVITYFDDLISNVLIPNNNNDDRKNFFYNKVRNEILDSEEQKFNSAILKKYLNSKKCSTVFKDTMNTNYLLPFISNKYQKYAINNAFNCDISIIQGPPGTGKTQTILNIICNAINADLNVLVVSNNNSAVDNVMEKINKKNFIYPFALRLGNMEEYINPLKENIEDQVNENIEKIENYNKKTNRNSEKYKEIYDEIEKLESNIEKIIKEKMLLRELLTQKRHIEKKLKIYDINDLNIKVRNWFIIPSLLKKEIELMYRGIGRKHSVILKAYAKFRFFEQLDFSIYTAYQWRLELIYANKVINYLDKTTRNLEKQQEKLFDLYSKLSKISMEIINDKLVQRYENFIDLKEVFELNKPGNNFNNSTMKKLFNCYPVFLTTLKSIPSNFSNSTRFDIVIIDESSQVDIITSLPALKLAGKSLVVVGDVKQLSHIVDNGIKERNDKIINKYDIPEYYDYSNTNFLSSIKMACQPNEQVLMDHYRCDYYIANYFNKKFYNGELNIFSKTANNSSIKIMPLNKEKCSGYELVNDKSRSSFYNKLEIKSILEYLGENRSNTSIITPYKRQEELLIQAIDKLKNDIGTIHKFQGRENDKVFLSTVLTKEYSHINKNNTLSPEIINVSISRAINEFVLFTNDIFFKDIGHELSDLINYIEVYGEKLNSNVSSIFEYLYRSMKFFRKSDEFDNEFEVKLFNSIKTNLSDDNEFDVIVKFPLANIISDKEYLIKNPSVKKFALNKNTHCDFVIVECLNNQPILVIELDGKYHNEKNIRQYKNDKKKNKIISDHGIPLWRIKSNSPVDQDDINEFVDKIINRDTAEEDIYEYLEKNSWKY